MNSKKGDWNPEFNGVSGMWNKFDLFFVSFWLFYRL